MECLDDDREYYMLIIHPENHDLLFVSTSKGVFASPDAGYTWVSINEGLPTLEHRIRDNVAQNLKITADGKSLILGLVDYGVWRADLTVLETELQVEFRRGDSNGDGEIDIADAVDLLFYLFLKDRTLACPDAADANDDRQIDIADPISLLSLLFGGAGDLPSPFPGCGSDPGQDLFAPCDYPHCPSF
jgi:hypothetical protein